MNNFNKNLPYTPPVKPAAPKGESKSEVGTYIIIAVIAFALGLGSGWLWNQKKVTPVAEVKDDETTDIVDIDVPVTQIPVENLPTDNLILVKDQTAGIEVAVERVILTNLSWVVVREDDGAGKPGKILGAQLFDIGTSAGKVELLRGTETGGTYYAMIYSDNGDRAFDPKLDQPILGGASQPIMSTFKAN